MTVNINQIQTNFANPNTSYTALSISVADVASGANSLIYRVGLNGNTVFAVDKKGCVTVRRPVSVQGGPILNIYDNSSDILSVNGEYTTFWRPIWAQSYAEGHEDISHQGSDLLISLANASVFVTNTASITSFNIKFPPNPSNYGARCWSFSVVLRAPCVINTGIWKDTGHYSPSYSLTYPGRGYDYHWTGGGPPPRVETDTILTFMHTNSWNFSGNVVWFAAVSGKNYRPINTDYVDTLAV